MANEIEVKLTANAEEVEKKLKDLQQRIQQMNSATTGGGSGSLSSDFKERAKLQLSKQVSSEIEKQTKEIEKLQKQYGILDRQINQNVISAEKMANAEKQRNTMLGDILNKEKELTQLKKTQASMQQRGGGFGGGFDKFMGTVGAVGLTTENVANAVGYLSELPVRRAGRQLGIAQQTTALRGRAISGGSARDLLFANDRREALNDTMGIFDTLEDVQGAKSLGRVLSRGAATVMGGKKSYEATTGEGGGFLGKIMGGVSAKSLGRGRGKFGKLGRVAGKASQLAGKMMPGFVAGGTALNIAAGSIQDDSTIAGLTYFGGEGEEMMNEMAAERALGSMPVLEQRNRMRNVNEYYQKEFFLNNRDTITGLQRSGGLSDKQMFGKDGFVNRGADQFTFDQRAGMTQQIIGAGGSGRDAGDLMLNALQAERGMGLSNAGQAFGRMSSYMDAGESKDAFIKILASGVSAGLDDSEFVEEQKDYLDQVTSIAQSIGGSTDLVAAGISAGIGDDRSRRGIAFAAQGFESLSDKMSTTGGVVAATRASLIAEDGEMKNIKGLQGLSFQNMDFRDITKDSKRMKMFYKMATGKTAEDDKEGFEDFVKRRRELGAKSMTEQYKDAAPGFAKVIEKIASGDYKKDELDDLITEGSSIYGELYGIEGKGAEKKSRTEFMQLMGIEKQMEKQSKEIKDSKTQKSLLKNTLIGRPMSNQTKTIVGDSVDPKIAGDVLSQGEAQVQAPQFTGFEETVKGFTKDMGKNVQTTKEDQTVMEKFNTAIGKGADEMDRFLKNIDKVNAKLEEKSMVEKAGDYIYDGISDLFSSDNNSSQTKTKPKG